jgi:predicted amidophosphoribosyltransferase
MAFPIKICAVCGEEFELKPDKPGFANRCPECSAPESSASATQPHMDADERNSAREVSEARKQAMRNLLYRKDS